MAPCPGFVGRCGGSASTWSVSPAGRGHLDWRPRRRRLGACNVLRLASSFEVHHGSRGASSQPKGRPTGAREAQSVVGLGDVGRTSAGRAVAGAVADRQVLTLDLGPLQRPDAADLRRKLREIRDAFAFVKFGDNPRARARVSPWAAAAVALDEGIEPIVHACCRDRNRLALQADLLGGRLLGVQNVLCLRGDEIEVSDQPEARAVRDLDVVDLIRLAAKDFCVLAACDPAAGRGDAHLGRLRAKVAAGAQLLETQPVFELDGFARWLRWLREGGIGVPLLVDVFVLAAPAEAELLERIPYVAAPADLAARLRRDSGAGVKLAAELTAGLLELDGVAGCHLSLLGGHPASALAVVERLS